jgi:hypothetical protein
MPQWLKAVIRLLAGLLLFDLLLNLPGLDPSSPAASLLAPSIDLLIVAAVCLGAVRSAEASRRVPRIVAAAAVVLLMACALGERFGYDVFAKLFGTGAGAGGSAVASLLVSIAGAAAVFVAAYLISSLVVAGFGTTIVQNVFLLLVAASVIVQVLVGARVFVPSVVPRVIQTVGALFR